MAVKDRTALIADINTIKDETEKGANTATRIGNMFNDLMDSVSNTSVAIGMDLDNDNFTIQNAGIYYTASAPTYSIIFPDASIFAGTVINVINTADSGINIQSTKPLSLDGNDINLINAWSCWQFISINNNWYLTNQYSV